MATRVRRILPDGSVDVRDYEFSQLVEMFTGVSREDFRKFYSEEIVLPETTHFAEAGTSVKYLGEF